MLGIHPHERLSMHLPALANCPLDFKHAVHKTAGWNSKAARQKRLREDEVAEQQGPGEVSGGPHENVLGAIAGPALDAREAGDFHLCPDADQNCIVPLQKNPAKDGKRMSTKAYTKSKRPLPEKSMLQNRMVSLSRAKPKEVRPPAQELPAAPT